MDYDKECHVLRFSYGKDSFKTLDVMHTRGMRLDMITTTDVWATENVPAWLPPMDEFKARMDQWIWTKYRLEVKHLCARNKDGSKRTYEQMFYHVPNRRSQSVQVERERERERERETGSGPAPSKGSQCSESHGVNQPSNGQPSYRVQGSIKGFPGITGVNWCQKLKKGWVPDSGIPSPDISMVPKAQDRLCQRPSFLLSTR